MSVLQSRVDTGAEAFAVNRARVGELVDELRRRLHSVTGGGRAAHVARHRERGKLLARERIDRLVDPGTAFLELSPLAAWDQYNNEVPGAGIVTGIGVVRGTPVVVIANDATVKGGSFFHETVKKHVRAQEIAEHNRLPVLYLVDCGGAYLPEQDRVFPDRDHFGNAFYRQCRMSAAGLPQIAIVFGGCTAGGAYIPALADDVIMVEGNARIHLGGPSIVKVAINEDIDGETLGGAAMHSRVSGVSDRLVATEEEGLARLRDLVGELNMQRRRPEVSPVRPPRCDPDELTGVVSADRRVPYDVHEVIARLVDDSTFDEFKPEWGETLVCGTARIFGHPVGLLGNNGALFSDSSLKAAHFIMRCDQRDIPLVFLHNISGFMVGSEAEQEGIAKHSAKMVYAMSIARVPRLAVIIGGSYGAGNYGMCGRGFRPDFLFAWPTAEVATMSADIAANVMLELRREAGGDAAAPDKMAELEQAVRAQYAEQSDPYYATSRLWDDGLIEPGQTREVLALCLDIVRSRPSPQGVDAPTHTPVYRL